MEFERGVDRHGRNTWIKNYKMAKKKIDFFQGFDVNDSYAEEMGISNCKIK